MAGLSIWHVVIFAIVVILLFGTSKLKNIGKDVGGAVRDFKKSVREEDEAASLNTTRTIDAQVKTSESTSVKS
ncbi:MULTISPECIES: Sec-independent protein translocase subunit TatA [Acinetobacter]|uniref:Sec-independent protein translocase subunit TatA n=1 Tax=Acinetobacter TaxID=469 RepID=UPI0008DD338E|nr:MULTISPECIES: Sec-independent protein translocase subunit TatA [Acinetobacter]OIG54392.1 preprotein translocase subunit TatA [Acinetobacter nosocomialis]OIG55293.1 preprotein translocase subunit TatA [Acinetobacter nosocomialis]OIH21481.1 preprotein translocase subunit TatA [Acinetobacter nosocomialis]